MSWSERAGRVLELLKKEPTVCLGDVRALEHARDTGLEPYHTLKALIERTERVVNTR